jgi:hypothetical protein
MLSCVVIRLICSQLFVFVLSSWSCFTVLVMTCVRTVKSYDLARYAK